jgi:hypothetical protein
MLANRTTILLNEEAPLEIEGLSFLIRPVVLGPNDLTLGGGTLNYFDNLFCFIGCCGEVLIALSSIDLVFEKGLSFLGIPTFGAFLGAPDFLALPEVISYNHIYISS